MDPWQPELDITHIRVRQRAVATSTIGRRRWQRGGRLMHHLIDPRTGQPAETDAVSVTVIAQRVALAEVYAKVALTLGVEAGRTWLNRIPEAEGLLVRADGQLISTEGFTNYLEVADDNPITNQSRNLSPEGPYDPGRRRGNRGTDRAALARIIVG